MTRVASLTRVADVDLELFTYGLPAAQPVLVLHDMDYQNGVDYPFISSLSKQWRVLAPSHPGFGRSSLPNHFDAIDDLAYVYLDFLREIGPTHVMGLGFGGWIAAEMAVRCTADIASLVLVDALGIKVSERTSADIKDMFVVSPADLVKLSWHDAALGESEMPLPTAHFDEDTLTMLLNNRRTAALVGWNPFMHSPKLRRRLARINKPTLVVWGESDGIVSPSYGRAYANSIPEAQLEVIHQAGHYPYLERPSDFVSVVESFLTGASRT